MNVVFKSWVVILGIGACMALIFLAQHSLHVASHNLAALSVVSNEGESATSTEPLSSEAKSEVQTAVTAPAVVTFEESNPTEFSEYEGGAFKETITRAPSSTSPVAALAIGAGSSSPENEDTIPSVIVSFPNVSNTANVLAGGIIQHNDVIVHCTASTTTVPSHAVRINEIAWMGTAKSTADEWIELKNTSSSSVSLTGWQLLAHGGKSDITIVFGAADAISGNGYYLLERTDDMSVPNIPADKIYTGALNNSAETIQLFDAACTLVDGVDTMQDFPSIASNPNRGSMELKDDDTFALYTNDADPVSGVWGTPARENSLRIAVIASSTDDTADASSTLDIDTTASSTLQSDSVIAGQADATSTDETISEASSTDAIDATSTDAIASSTPDIDSATSSDVVSGSSSTSSGADLVFAASSTEEQSASSSSLIIPADHVVISEIAFDAVGSDAGKEFVEFYNPTESDVDMGSWSLNLLKTDATSTELLARFGSSASDTTAIAAHGFFLVGLNNYDAANFNDVAADVHRIASLPNGENEKILLRDAGGTEIDEMNYGFSVSTSTAGQSLERNTVVDGACVAAVGDAENGGNSCDTDSDTDSDTDFTPRTTPLPQNTKSATE
ncbi:MAG: lamin tail domain-containing protein [Patescibacteria group bacterium]|nr:lamin tail domain-containing protein [Patescibacteria group bacterium]MDE2438377.1 lamin tail domain-containing protein [Patescibacteria group bacterium]